MGRLTKNGRAAIHDRAMKAAFEGEYLALVEARRLWAEDAYMSLFTPKEYELLPTLPKGWLGKSSSLYIRIGTHDIAVPYDGDCYKVRNKIGAKGPKAIERLEPANWSSYNRPQPRNANTGKRLLKRIAELNQWADDLETEVLKASRELTGLISQASTVKRLEVIWPEGKPFYEADLPPEPVVAQRAEVNKKLGLVK